MSAPSVPRETTRPAARALRSAWDSPVASYYLIGGVTLVLTCLGLVFVLSSSTVDDLSSASGSPLTTFLGQARYALIGLPLAFLASRVSVRWLRRLAWPGFLFALGLQLLPLVPGLAITVGGNVVGVGIAGFTFAPSEFGKLGLALWLGLVLAARRQDLASLKHVALPVGGSVLLVGLQFWFTQDLGTTLVLGALVAGALFVAGLPLRIFAAFGVPALAVLAFFATQGTTRSARILALLQPDALDSQGLGYQSKMALQALGTGGVSGVGLGASRTKWNYLPEAHNDFILAIVGEELGLLGTLLMLVLFALLAVGMTRVVMRHTDPFAKIATGAIASWILAQALVNIGVVINVLPVIGIPLPLVSAGGSSLIATLLALGVVLAFARSEPGAAEALAARRGAVRRSFSVLTSRSGRVTGVGR
ncbi:peptidoglycan glycosyltransferase FtsW [Serinibacter salmoneus]|uniref:Probable peptidoglycan glycosyltransferase FtsW n=1 Tax=Serinibacter salmoneus TaxID=556530 RepID=A0A2A9CZ40_9MICO|nr:putative peptidoglycan glycosyltransferase FtsW [Serinibacter salmoneus]PFG19386.1 cell division-specific peptidoglycan biosynthesis regulator FtsW [Serinibacter salmoneus]